MSSSPDHCHPDRTSRHDDEFAPGASQWPSDSQGTSRREFLVRMTAALALAGVIEGGCRDRPREEKIVATVNPGTTPLSGVSRTYASAMNLGGYARGILAISMDGRPIKIEGNPEHPSSLGGTDALMQASILDLYDPARAVEVRRSGAVSSWEAFDQAMSRQMERYQSNQGAGLALLTGTVTSPTMVDQLARIRQRYPKSRWHTWEPWSSQNITQATLQAFGQPLRPIYDFTQAKTVVAIDSDFFFDDPASPAYARHFIDGRRVRADQTAMNRLYVVESAMSLTGSMADHRLPVRASQIGAIVLALAHACGVQNLHETANLPHTPWIQALARELVSQPGQSLLLAGAGQPAWVHQLVFAINATLKNIPRTVRYIASPELGAGDESTSLPALEQSMHAGQVTTLLIVGDNPAYSAPADSGFAEALLHLSESTGPDAGILTAHLGPFYDETSYRCQWHLPMSHDLEQWGDLRAYDGTASIVQPLILPLHGGRASIELLEQLLGSPTRSAYEIVRDTWRRRVGNVDFESAWAQALQKGVLAGTAFATVNVPTPPLPTIPSTATTEGIELVFRPDYSVWDGRFARNAWLQELPRPFSKIVWDNAALLGPATAQQHGVSEGDVIRLEVKSRSIELPVAIVPGTPEGTATLHLGYGQDTHLGTSLPPDIVGCNVAALRGGSALAYASGATLTHTAKTHDLTATHSHHAMAMPQMPGADPEVLAPHAMITPELNQTAEAAHNRRLVRLATIQDFRSNPDIVRELGGEKEKKPLLSLYPEWDYSKGYQWGMTIDLTSCIGCNACMLACQAENNIPVVGKEQVRRGREMHWIRIDTYAQGPDPENPAIVHQPVPCMHCENAPCELVCPVGATTHSVEGLNQMIYNRCVGTRYCSNNCPYKVRRFNFLDYTRPVREASTLQLLQNPEVTVRARGVMEKCSYCVQRAQHKRIEIERMRVQALEAGEKPAAIDQREFELLEQLQTACQQACPTRAIMFGSILPVAQQVTQVMRSKNEPTNYVLLRELTTRPRTSYLARLTNPNPDMPGRGGGT